MLNTNLKRIAIHVYQYPNTLHLYTTFHINTMDQRFVEATLKCNKSLL